jgi:hypothetical protein
MIPKLIFIVPYRNRPQHKFFFSNYLKTIMDTDTNTNYEIYFSHQCDTRAFNRGAVKNIGFLAVKKKYPEHYKNMTFIFNDIDTIPFSNIFNYETTPGIVKHFYGFNYALGGIVAFNGADFEKTNGFPNYWGWGMEDNVIQKRCENLGLTIDRTEFYQIGSPNILHMFDGMKRIINRKDPWRAKYDNGIDGIKTIHKLQYSIDTNSINELDNIHTVTSNNIFIINIKAFMTGIKFEDDNYIKYDLREPPRKIINPNQIKTQKVNHLDLANEWVNIDPSQGVIPQIELRPIQSIQSIQHQNQQQQSIQRQNQQQQSIQRQNQQQQSIKRKPPVGKSVNIRLGGIY